LPWDLAPTALMVWEQLRSSHRSQIRDALSDLAERSNIDSDPNVVTIQAGQQSVKVLRLHRYHVFLRQDGDRIVVLDIASRAQIDALRSARERTAA
jgi:mRNA-degrading endonuclease RelE of RelBE toxin-antitoxin system